MSFFGSILWSYVWRGNGQSSTWADGYGFVKRSHKLGEGRTSLPKRIATVSGSSARKDYSASPQRPHIFERMHASNAQGHQAWQHFGEFKRLCKDDWLRNWQAARLRGTACWYLRRYHELHVSRTNVGREVLVRRRRLELRNRSDWTCYRQVSFQGAPKLLRDAWVDSVRW